MARFAEVEFQEHVPCAMRDGIILQADIYRPQTDVTLPVLLMRQPYGKSIASTVTYAHPSWYARQGFIVVIQDVRGRGGSEGIFDPFVQELTDGYDAVEWAAKLPGSNGRVGMYGFSYQGYTQWAAAAARPPHLTAIAPAMSAADLYRGWFYPTGRFSLGGTLPWAAQLARDEARRKDLPAVEAQMSAIMKNPRAFIDHLPQNDISVLKTLAPYYQEWVEHCEDDDYWAKRNLLPILLEQCVPTYHIAGWFDPYLQGTLQTYARLEEQAAAHRHRLLVGPWGHIPWGRYVAEQDYGVAAAGRVDTEMVKWFNHWLRDADELEAASPVRYFVLGRNQWAEADTWSTAVHQGVSTWYLQSHAAPANGALGGGRLCLEPVETEDVATDVFVYDARLPMECDSFLPVSRQRLQDRYEILVYTSEKCQDILYIAGAPSLSAWVDAVNAPTDLVAILSVVGRDGRATFLSIGRCQIDAKQDETTWREVLIEMRPVCIEIAKGESIRLELTGSAYPLMSRHPNGMDETGIPFVGAEKLNIATVAVACGAKCPSKLVLPLGRWGASV
ncbi:CocE/NonD family hydrolase [Alicyclobacillus fodiniaquatilis]|uniref:CocE/NonD family hydrolase n=1 Tax=Alicyclobacillus fodiniaquatilis TaxID=1661150 RepID=A0ABW4JPP9_9BACL